MASKSGRGTRWSKGKRSRIKKQVAELAASGKYQKAIAGELGISVGMVNKLLAESAPPPAKEKKKPLRISHVPVENLNLPRGKVHRFLVTSAQDDTPVHEQFVANMEAYAAFMGAEIIVGPGTYQKGMFQDHSVEAGVYDSRIARYIRNDRIQVTDDLLIISSANILPTTANPLQGFTTANRGHHVIVPHARVAFQSLRRFVGQPPRYAVSTGTCTLPNYVPRAAGQKALPHHTFGFTMVEIDTDGEVFPRPVFARPDGSFQDMDVAVTKGRCFPGRRIRALICGDIHFEQMCPEIALATWGFDMETRTCVHGYSILDTLKPDFQFLHDTVDFRRRNHHSIHDPHQMAAVHRRGANVEQEVAEAKDFVNAIRRDWCRTVIVESNHDSAIGTWLKNPEGFKDPENAYYWHELNAVWHRAIMADDGGFNVVEHAMRTLGLAEDVEFVPVGGSHPEGKFVVDGVECGSHGHVGGGGRPGSPAQLKQFGRPTNTAHTHSPQIIDQSFIAGVSAELDQKYNLEQTTWAHAHIVHYFNGLRTLLCMTADGRHRAIGDIPAYAMAA